MANHAGFKFPDIDYGKWAGAPAWLNASTVNNRHGIGFEISSLLIGTSASTQPVTENPVAHSAHILPGFADDFYNRILIEPNTIDAGNLIGEQFYVVYVFNGYFQNKTLENLIFDDTVGIGLTGPAVNTSWGPLETKQYQLTIRPDGPPIIASTMSFDWEGISDDIVIGVKGVRIIMLPYQAQVPWKESFEWKTNVLETNSGIEQRIKIRKSPRHYIEADYPIDKAHMAASVNMINGWIGKRWAVGMWSETQKLGALINGVNVIFCDTTKADFRAGGMLLVWESTDNNEALEIDSITPTQINLKRVVVGVYTNATIMPVRMGMPKGGIISRTSNGFNSALGVSYTITDNMFISSDVPEQYLNEDIYWDVSLMGDDSSFTEQIKTRQDEVDYESGLVDYFAPWKNSRRARGVRFFNEGPEECWIFKKWLNRRNGRLRPYWLPTFEENLRLHQEGIVSSFITIHDDNYKNLGLAHDHIAILLNDGTWLPRKVTGISNASVGFISIALDSPLFVDAASIIQISFLALHRLDSDRIEIDWIGNNVNVSSIRILEIKP